MCQPILVEIEGDIAHWGMCADNTRKQPWIDHLSHYVSLRHSVHSIVPTFAGWDNSVNTSLVLALNRFANLTDPGWAGHARWCCVVSHGFDLLQSSHASICSRNVS